MEKKVCLYSPFMPPRGLTAVDGSWPSQTFALEAPLCKYFMKHLLRLINLRMCARMRACVYVCTRTPETKKSCNPAASLSNKKKKKKEDKLKF